MKAMTFDKSFAEKKDTLANLIANLSRMVLTTSERLFYIKLLTRGFRSTPMYIISNTSSFLLLVVWPGAPSGVLCISYIYIHTIYSISYIVIQYLF